MSKEATAMPSLKQIVTPPVFEDERQTRIAKPLHTSLLALLSTSLVLITWQLAIYGTPTNYAERFTLLSAVAVGGISAGFLILLHHGRVTMVGALISFMVWAIVTMWGYRSSSINTVLIAAYFLAVTIASLIWGGLGAQIASLICILTLLGLFYVRESESGSIVSQAIHSLELLALVTNLLLVALLLRTTSRSTANALERAQQSESVLAQTNRELQREIDERKHVEEVLRESEQKYRNLVERANDGIAIIQNGRVAYVNPRLTEMRGEAADEIVGTPLTDYVHPNGLREVVDRYEQHTAGKNVTPVYEATLQHKNGGNVYAELNAETITYQGKPAELVIVRDITRRKQAEVEREQLLAKLKRRSIQLKIAAEISRAASTILDPDELINQTVNLIQERFGFYYVGLFLLEKENGTPGKYAVLRAGTGETGCKMIASGHKLKVGGPSMIGWCTIHGQARIALDVGEEKVRFDNPMLPKTRSEMALPLALHDQTIGALTVQSTEEAAFSEEDIAILQSVADQIAIALDNAELYNRLQDYANQLEQRVAERTAELTAVNKELETFAYSVSHDLRAPLRSIDGFSQALLEDYPDKLDAVGRDYLNRVRASAQRMGQLIDELLELSRVTRGEIHRERVNLSDLAQDIAKDLQQQSPDRQATFTIEPDLVVDGDARLLEVMLRNLLDNAWKFTGNRPCAKIELGYTKVAGEPAYFVRDNGAGFDMAYADKLFSAFQRLHRRTEFPGTGIGLATVQRIIHRHGGQVWAEGKQGQGATFYFTLPARR